MSSGELENVAKCCARGIQCALHRKSPIPIRARQAADPRTWKRSISGVTTVYESQKTVVYRQKYRGHSVDLAGFSETTVDSRLDEILISSMTYNRPETMRTSAPHTALSGAFLFSNTQFKNVVETSSTPFSGNASFDGYDGSLIYRLTPSMLLGVSYDWETGMAAHYGTLGLGIEYPLSKTTLVYLSSSWMHASGINSLGAPAVAANYFVTASTTPNQVTTVLALRHTF